MNLQKILVFIPVVNIVVAVLWLISRIKSKRFSASIIVLPIVAIGACLIGALIRSITDIAGVSGNAYTIVTYVTLYLQSVVGPFLMLIDEIVKSRESFKNGNKD